MPLWVCSAATEGWSAIQRREETGTEAFWWCNWQQMWRKIAIKEKEFKIISVWACIGELSWAERRLCFDFCLTDSLLPKCFHFTVVWAMESWHISDTTAVVILCRKRLWKHPLIKLGYPHLIRAHTEACTENKLDMLIYATHFQLLVNSIISATHFVSPNISWEEDLKFSSTASQLWKQSNSATIGKSCLLLLKSWQRKRPKKVK